ncbi:DUF1800 family protein [Sphingomonas sp. SUN039]|uniref:DUF1800 domain-containing protein n=1 Tax=Sphingomonas sp. SUN039 TaxID=2937787 RepID=UPI002164D8DC|nr:DUF1800 domain-containing protein [Sphingomonas sp. SUN039]UVO53932.1 DUF1800 domain-containing protein [Sphingomonas sp. SUN039]
MHDDAEFRTDTDTLFAPALPDGAPDEIAVPKSLTGIVTATLPALALAACGGDGGSAPTSVTPTPTPTPTVVAPTKTQASRFLGQTTMGVASADVDKVVAQGYDAWIAEQFATPRATTFWDWLVAGGYNAAANINGQAGFDPAVWKQLISGQDQLRQRTGMALLNMLVVGIDGLNTNWKAFAQAGYMDVLWDNAFGNYRDIMDKISLNAAMGYWLTYIGNRKANTTTGAQPDENYARELMQLFTIGLYKLNADGTQQLTGGNPVETYTQDDVQQLARVFTGFTLDSTDSTTPDRLRRPLINVAANYETGAKAFLGATIPAGTTAFESLRLALDAIFAHTNVPPFVSKQLIQRFVTSNPSAAYVGRVSAVFTNNGSGVRGDMKAVIRAILTDTEARSDTNLTNANFGHLREPVMRLTNWARAFGVTSASDAWAIGNTSSSLNRLAESPGHSPSVFNFFRPGYAPPNTAIATAGLVAPEMQITNEPSVIAYVNYMQTLIQSGTGDVRADYTAILTKATDTNALVDEVNLLVANGQLGSATVSAIQTAVASIGTTTAALLNNRVYTAILLTMASPDYLAQK